MSDGDGGRYRSERSDFWLLAGLLLLTVFLSNRHYHGIVRGRPQAIEQIGAVLILPLLRGAAGVVGGCRYLSRMADGRLARDTVLLAGRAEDLASNLEGLSQGQAAGRSPFPDLPTQRTILEAALARRLPAPVLGSDPTNWAQGVLVGCGSRQGVHPGDPVVLGADLVGLVTRVYRSLSIVRWISDPQIRVDLRDARTGEAIGGAVGPTSVGEELLRLELENGSADVREGDLLVTSGFRGFAPAGLQVGRVWRCQVGGSPPGLPARKPGDVVTVWIRPFHPRPTWDPVSILPMASVREGAHGP